MLSGSKFIEKKEISTDPFSIINVGTGDQKEQGNSSQKYGEKTEVPRDRSRAI